MKRTPLCGFVRNKGWLSIYRIGTRYYPNYSVEVSDADVNVLGITGPEDTMILNIVTLHLIKLEKFLESGCPIIVNRRTPLVSNALHNHRIFAAVFLMGAKVSDL